MTAWVIQARKEGQWVQIGVAKTREKARKIKSGFVASRPEMAFRVKRGDREANRLLAYLEKKFGGCNPFKASCAHA